MKNKKTTLSHLFEELNTNGRYPMHMPGHKRNFPYKNQNFTIPYNIDVTEIEGFDNLHSMNGVLKGLSERAADLYEAEAAYVTVGGSTCGILSSIRAMTRPGDRVILARNCHKSVYHALSLCHLRAEYIYPEFDPDSGIACSVISSDIQSALERFPEARLVIVTSPTYEGVVSDLKSISEVVHKYGARLLVDAAHGAHILPDMIFGDDSFWLGKKSFLAVNEIKYADVAIVSIHKTLPSLTQTALILIYGTNSDYLKERISTQIDVFESSSPSYILLYSVEKCIECLEKDRQDLYLNWAKRTCDFENFVRNLKYIKVFGYTSVPSDLTCFDFDKSKITILCNRIVFKDTGKTVSGKDIAKILRKHNIEPEMIAVKYVLLMTSICDTEKGYKMLKNALCDMDNLFVPSGCEDASYPELYPKNKIVKEIYECEFSDGEKMLPEKTEGRVSADYITPYPPGIPLVVPGEIISADVINTLKKLKSAGIYPEHGEEITVL